MKEYKRVVDVPAIEEDERAYNHHRPISSLIMHQLHHLHAVEQRLPPKERSYTNVSTLHTELEASKYIQKVMKKLHPLGKKKSVTNAGKRKPVAISRKNRTTKGKRK